MNGGVFMNTYEIISKFDKVMCPFCVQNSKSEWTRFRSKK